MIEWNGWGLVSLLHGSWFRFGTFKLLKRTQAEENWNELKLLQNSEYYVKLILAGLSNSKVSNLES